MGPSRVIPKGLFDHDTRILSRHRLTVDGEDLRFVSVADLEADRRLALLLASRPTGCASGPVLPQDAIDVRVEVVVGPGMAERGKEP
jgi:glycogen debranching enzyme-like protein